MFGRRSVVLGISSLSLLSPFEVLAEGQGFSDGSESAGETKVVEMLNYYPTDNKKRMMFYPLITVVQPGKSILFKRADGGHDSVSIEGMIPENAQPWRGKIGQDIEVTFTMPGFYDYVCGPHATWGWLVWS